MSKPFSTAADAESLLAWCRSQIDDALALVAAHDGAGRPDFAALVGPHLRHLIEHYEALLHPAEDGVIDYDRRPRDREVERSPRLARRRLLAVREGLRPDAALALAEPVRLLAQAGAAGEFVISLPSSLGRELLYLASHAVHHFALLQRHCREHGIAVDADFGKAPSTVAHERAANTSAKDIPCLANAFPAAVSC